jgi:multiple sugar transport system ATP-binding protein
MAFGLKLAKEDKDEIKTRVENAARILQMEHLLTRLPKELSGGQRQRVAIGRAIVRKPGVFLFDEPLSNLDAALRVQTRIEIAKLHNDLGASMIYVTHDQVEAMTLADKILLLNAGKAVLEDGSVAQVGPPLELYHHPNNMFVAGFIGSPKMNFLPGVISNIESGMVKVTLSDGDIVHAAVDGTSAKTGDNVTLGVRPEHLVLGKAAPDSINGEVMYVEHLGDATFFYLKVQGADNHVVVRVEGDAQAKMGEALTIGRASRNCHLFNNAGRAYKRVITKTDETAPVI